MPMSTPSLVFKTGSGYAEENQQNPLRWAIFKNSGDTFTQQTYKMKCKDFFNDFVAKYHGSECNIYGMNTASVEVDSYGMFLGLWETTPQFIGNIEQALNPKLEQEVGVKLYPVQVGEVVLLLLPRCLFDSTYTTSLVTLLIRACNDAKEWSCYDHLVSESIEPLVLSRADWLKSANLLPPEHLREFWFYSGPEYNDKTITNGTFSFSSYVHNCGFLAWKAAKGFVK